MAGKPALIAPARVNRVLDDQRYRRRAQADDGRPPAFAHAREQGAAAWRSDREPFLESGDGAYIRIRAAMNGHHVAFTLLIGLRAPQAPAHRPDTRVASGISRCY